MTTSSLGRGAADLAPADSSRSSNSAGSLDGLVPAPCHCASSNQLTVTAFSRPASTSVFSSQKPCEPEVAAVVLRLGATHWYNKNTRTAAGRGVRRTRRRRQRGIVCVSSPSQWQRRAVKRGWALNKPAACSPSIRHSFPFHPGARRLRGPDTYGATNELMANHGAYYIVDTDIMAARPGEISALIGSAARAG